MRNSATGVTFYRPCHSPGEAVSRDDSTPSTPRRCAVPHARCHFQGASIAHFWIRCPMPKPGSNVKPEPICCRFFGLESHPDVAAVKRMDVPWPFLCFALFQDECAPRIRNHSFIGGLAQAGCAGYPAFASCCSTSVAHHDAPTGRISSLKSYFGWCSSGSPFPLPPPSIR